MWDGALSYLLLTILFLFFDAAVIITLGFPDALKHWTNEQVLNFVHMMWDKTKGDELQADIETELDPLNFLPTPASEKVTSPGNRPGPLEASVVVEVAKKAYATLVANGVDVFSRRRGSSTEPSFGSPLAGDAIMIESSTEDRLAPLNPLIGDGLETENGHAGGSQNWLEQMPTKQTRSFVAPPEPDNGKKQEMPDPARKQRIVEWLCSNIEHLNELSQLPFSSRELWRLHQHYFTPVVNETGGAVLQYTGPGNRIGSSVPDVTRGNPGRSAFTPSTPSSEDQFCSVPVSDPALLGPPAAPTSLPMLKRKVSYRFLGDAVGTTQTKFEPRMESSLHSGPVARMIAEGHTGHSLPPKTKKARRNRTRISFLPRIKAKLDSYLDVCHEKALITMRQLYFVDQAILSGQVNPLEPSSSPRTHLGGILASEAEMIIVDMI